MFRVYFKERTLKQAGLALNLYIDKGFAKLVPNIIFNMHKLFDKSIQTKGLLVVLGYI